MTPGTAPSESELERQREIIRRNLLRANTAVVVVLLAVLALAAAAVLFSHRAAQQRRAAEQQQRRAEEAEAHGREQIYRSSLAQARAERLSGQSGARVASLAAISNAAAI